MPADVFYRGYRIVSDVQEAPGGGVWKPKASVVRPADVSRVERVHPIITDASFPTEETASDFIIAAAKKWIDDDIASTGS